MSAPEATSAEDGPVTMMDYFMQLDYHELLCPVVRRFSSQLLEGRLVGHKCPSCGLVYVPPRGYCPICVVPTTDAVHPTPLYEAAFYLLIFVVLWRQRGRPLPPGNLFGQYLLYTGAVRFAVEFVRRNPAVGLGLTLAQWVSLLSMAIGAALLLRGYRGSARADAQQRIA